MSHIEATSPNEATSIFIIHILHQFPRKWRFCCLKHVMETMLYLQMFYAIYQILILT